MGRHKLPRTPMKIVLGIAGVAMVLATAACDRSPVAYGASNRIIVVAPEALWSSVEDTVLVVLEPPIFTVREERTFEVTHVSPADPNWGTLRMWRQILLVGEPDDIWVEPALRRVALPDMLPAFVEGNDVWARGQRVTAVLLPPGGGRDELLELLPELHAFLDSRFRSHVLQRMFISGRDDALRNRLEREAGFSLLLPNVYRHGAEDSTYVFRNDQRRGGDLIRSILVTWQSGAPESLDPEMLLAWRDSIGTAVYEPNQLTSRDRVDTRALTAAHGIEVQGLWTSLPGEWPSAGPFLQRAVVCPDQDRTYFLDAWLYAPTQEKYEYMIQLETILDSFACGRPS